MDEPVRLRADERPRPDTAPSGGGDAESVAAIPAARDERPLEPALVASSLDLETAAAPPPRRRRRWLWILTAALGCAVIAALSALLAFAVLHGRDQERLARENGRRA